MAGVDIQAAYGPRQPQLDDCPVVAAIAAPPCFPAIHPFAVVVELAGNEYRFGRLQCAFGRRNEFVLAGRYAGTAISAGQIGGTGRNYWCLAKRYITTGSAGDVLLAL